MVWGHQIIGFAERQVLSLLVLLIGERKPIFYGFVFMLVGLGSIVVAVKYAVKSILEIIVPEQEAKLIDVLFERRLLQSGPRIVVIGGGTGLSVLLRGLKHYTSNITAIVTVADDGGSSGRLRGDMGILPPGDIRNCVLALADTEPLLEKLFQYRFSVGELEGHSFGNLLIAAMTSITGDFQLAIKEFSKVLAVRGRVLPVTASDIRLVAELYDGSTVLGESKVSECGCNIKSLRLEPPNAEPLPEVLQAIAEADALVLGPGSLFTSVIPNLLVSGMSQAIARSVATKIYICNVMTQPGETTQFTASQHVDAIQRLANARIIDFVLVNTARIKADLLSKYSAQNSAPVLVDMHRLNQLGVRVVADDLLHQCSVVRHDPEKLARRVMRLIINNTISTERRRRQRKQKRN
ncbi:MAG: hypothetical protein FD169_2339 [Bacillota bacterium]|nr:MAG: hypothetical protein FD169_2339 [Bacillota bacterium]